MSLWDWITGNDDKTTVSNVSSPQQKQILQAMMPLILQMFQGAGSRQGYPNYNAYQMPQHKPRVVNDRPVRMPQMPQQNPQASLINAIMQGNMSLNNRRQ